MIRPTERVKLALAYALEGLLATGHPLPPPPLRSPWDAWWIGSRSALPPERLGLDPAGSGEPCRHCVAQVVTLTATVPPGQPPPDQPCDCVRRWAELPRVPGPRVEWPAMWLNVALVKPGAPAGRVLELLEEDYAVLDRHARELTIGDVRRLYPQPTPSAELDAYLLSGPVEVAVLLSRTAAAVPLRRVKERIRWALTGGDAMRNHVHMPDNPGEILCDLDQFLGPARAAELYRRHDSAGAAARLAAYSVLLAGPATPSNRDGGGTSVVRYSL